MNWHVEQIGPVFRTGNALELNWVWATCPLRNKLCGPVGCSSAVCMRNSGRLLSSLE